MRSLTIAAIATLFAAPALALQAAPTEPQVPTEETTTETPEEAPAEDAAKQ